MSAAPELALSRTTFVVGSTAVGGPDAGWGDGIDVTGSGYTPGTVVVISLMDGPDEEARTTVVSSATGEIVLDDWLPSRSDGFSTYPHLPRAGERISVVASGIDAAGEPITSSTVPLTMTRPAAGVSFVVAEDGGRIEAGSEVGVAGFRVFEVVALLVGFDRDELVTTTLTAPDGSVTTLTADDPWSMIYGETFVRLDESTMADQLGTFTVTGVGTTSGRSASASLVQVAGEPGIRIWPSSAPSKPGPDDGQPTSGGALWGFASNELVSVSIHSVDGTRQRLADGSTGLAYTADGVGWSPIALGRYPLDDPDAEVYCVVALGATSGRTASTSYDYGTTESDLLPESADCSVAEAAARAGATTGAGSGSGTGVTAGRPVLAATGVSPAAPFALAAFGILGGLALMITRRRRA
ncbi:hypothetical protein B0T42_01905 [Rathayibacter sp. VKM Ac-2630]|nr:hypothetical protein B0T42_01905 [Rathayibacter sp. VKM Ac-2630]